MFQKLLGKLADAPAHPKPSPVQSVPPLAPPIAKAPPTPPAPVHSNGKGVELPLRPIIAGLPLELQPRLKNQDAGALTICVPLEKILSQLSSGVVKISFGELRQAAPDLFSAETDRDNVPVAVPLAEVLSRLNPALIRRRREQKLVEVPADIQSPFNRHGQGLVLSTSPPLPEAAPAPRLRQTTTAPPPSPVPPARSSLTFTPAPAPPTAAPSTPVRPAREPSAGHAPPKAPATAPSAPRPQAPNEPLLVALSSLAEGWPEAVRREIVQLSIVDAKMALPADVIERALKQGRVAFTWKMVRSWIKPAPLPAVSAHDATLLELPLKIVAPLFLARQHEANRAQRKVAVDADIPNLFFGFPQTEPAAAKAAPRSTAPAPKPADTNYYVWDDTSDRAKLQEDGTGAGPSPGTKFVAKYATPNEIVSRAASLDGVTGALIALPDGLMVASRISSDLNGETLAAFLPQIFGKVNQCTKELRMGELNNLNFTVGNVPWKIFRVNAIFFAAFGRAGEPLPTAALAALAAELDHKPK